MKHRSEVTSLDDADRRRVGRYLRGEPETFAEVEEWIRGEIRMRYPVLRHELDDVCQTVHEKLLIKLRADGFRYQSSLRTYVSGIVHHSCIDRLRRRYRENAIALGEDAGRVSKRPDPYEVLAEVEEWRLLHQVVLLSSSACRELWSLAFIERLSYEEIGRRLSIPPGTVKSRMWHCRQRAAAALRRIQARRGSRPNAPGRRSSSPPRRISDEREEIP
jgi:RNA polymerase sigma-70 factor (ECF subfamily)